MIEQFLNLQRFLDAGGPVLWAILGVAIVLWTLIIERYWHHWRVFPGELTSVRAKRRHAPGTDRRLARKILEKDVSELRQSLTRSLFLIRTMIAVCPLLGLLGTVTGMILVFDTIGFSGTGNPRAMAAGVSMATIPTMAGLVVALSGFVFSIRLQRGGRSKARQAADVLLRDLLEAEGRKEEGGG
ncbi:MULTISPECIES: MotA/TolQ/ExbB proton channel family protein [Desulfonatronum]|jgi:biopolymer transport protein ExbB|uniref:MotA/TolQ/ExbB proton channel family protein n=1 Tax=Desulfonatronum TaxID=66848 RepID=UPI0006915DDC|nr:MULTISPECIES: MotA/TolQ/ExbB proton channel family protein [Desulfonatronum]PTN38780.1 MotA/TolQ/ExbB proton channel family protein [Desulfonatronum sp. SC1]